MSPKALDRIFPKALIEQEVSSARYIPIPDEVLDAYKTLGRPTPLRRAVHLERFLNTPAKIYFKCEYANPAGSHKPNTAIAQAYYNQKEGTKRLVTETGAGQWGSALALACSLFKLDCRVYMTRTSYSQKPYRKTIMQLFGAEVFPSPSDQTGFGRKLLAQDPDHPGSLGIAISEAIEDAVSHPETKYSLGSVLNHVMLHQTIIGQEAIKQMELAGDVPDILMGCIGGGSNFCGFAYPFMREKLLGKQNYHFIAAEPKAVPSVTRGEYRYDFGDTAGLAPLLKMYTVGHRYVTPPIHAGGLRYHGKSPSLCLLASRKLITAVAYNQREAFEAGILFAKTEGIMPAPETNHAIKAVIDEALTCKRTGEAKKILFNLSGHGLLDLTGYDDFLSRRLQDFTPSEIDLTYLPSIR